MIKLDLWSIYEMCEYHCVDYDQIGVIIPRIYDLLTDTNQMHIFNLIGNIADNTACDVEFIIKVIRNIYVK